MEQSYSSNLHETSLGRLELTPSACSLPIPYHGYRSPGKNGLVISLRAGPPTTLGPAWRAHIPREQDPDGKAVACRRRSTSSVARRPSRGRNAGSASARGRQPPYPPQARRPLRRGGTRPVRQSGNPWSGSSSRCPPFRVTARISGTGTVLARQYRDCVRENAT